MSAEMIPWFQWWFFADKDAQLQADLAEAVAVWCMAVDA